MEGSPGLDPRAAEAAGESIGAAGRVADRIGGEAGAALAQAADGAFVSAMSTALTVGTGVALAGALFAMIVMPRKQREPKAARAPGGARVSERLPPARGRPRSAEAHGAILGAAAALLAEGGFTQLTMEAVAARAGVSKATVYRRWGSKEELVLDLVTSMPYPGEAPDTGSVEGDLLELTRIQIDRIADTPLPRMMPRLMAETFEHPELHAAIVEHVSTCCATLWPPSSAAASSAASCARTSTSSWRSTPCTARSCTGSCLSGGDIRSVVGYGPRMYGLLLQGLRP